MAPEVEFLREQDGDAERDFKLALTRHFKLLPKIKRAYLAKVRYVDGETSVCLALDVVGGEDRKLVDLVRVEFAKIFNSKEHVDTMFLEADSLKEVARVAKPFYVATQ